MSTQPLVPAGSLPEVARWHDVECGAYTADLALWRDLARHHSGAILDVGAGTGRVALELAGRGHRVTALDHDRQLSEVLRSRAGGLEIDTVVADARKFDLGRSFSLILVPMQTVQLLGASSQRIRFLRCARRHLEPAGVVAVALTEELETYEVRDGFPVLIPDVLELDGIVYSSQPTAIRRIPGGYVLDRRRERVWPDGRRETQSDHVRLYAVDGDQLEREAIEAGLRPVARRRVRPTSDHVGSLVVILGA
jgi:SAM-dependent methyltransferase